MIIHELIREIFQQLNRNLLQLFEAGEKMASGRMCVQVRKCQYPLRKKWGASPIRTCGLRSGSVLFRKLNTSTDLTLASSRGWATPCVCKMFRHGTFSKTPLLVFLSSPFFSVYKSDKN
jgi:hypothetical protein